MKFGPVVQEEKSFQEKNYGRQTGRRLITITHIEPSAQVSEKVSRQKKINETNSQMQQVYNNLR